MMTPNTHFCDLKKNCTKWVLGGHHRVKLGFLKNNLFEKTTNIFLQLLAKFWPCMSIFASLLPFSIVRLSNPCKTRKSPFFQILIVKIIDIPEMRIDTDMCFYAKVPRCKQISRSIKSNKIKRNLMKKIFLPEMIEISTFFKTDIAENGQKNDVTMKKNRFLKCKFC